MIWLTSDTHFGHKNIIEYCNRPFKDVDHMNAEIVRRWNSVVHPDDLVYHLGDVALGHLDDSLSCISRLNGTKVLVCGNHDRPFMTLGKARFEEWLERYRQVFNEVILGSLSLDITTPPRGFELCHFPYDGDSHDEDRYAVHRPVDEGLILLHGHTHSTQVVTRSKSGTMQIHVGVDAHDYYPVPMDKVIDIVESHGILKP